MINLTKTRSWLHNGIDLIPLKMALGKIGSSVVGAVMAFGTVGEAAADGHEALVERIDPAVLEQIQANYQICVQDALKGSDWDGNFRIEGEEAAFYHNEALPLCDESAESQLNIAISEQQIAHANARIANANESIAQTNQELLDLVRGKTATN